MKLFFGLIQLAPALIVTIALAWMGFERAPGSVGWMILLALMSLSAILHPAGIADPVHYRALNLPMSLRTEHSRVLAVYFGLLTAATWWWVREPLVYVLPCAALTYRLWKPLSVSEQPFTERALALSDGRTSFGRLPSSPVAQLVVRPLVKAWLLLFVVAWVAVAATWMVTRWMDFGEVTSLIGTVSFLFGMALINGIHGDTLRAHLTYGGTRSRWARLVVGLSMVWLLLAALSVVIVRVATGSWFPEIAGLALLIVPLLVTPSLANWKDSTFLVTLCFYVVAIPAIIWAMATDRSHLLLAIGIAVYGVWIPVHVWQARRVDPSKPTFDTWFGLSSRA